MELKKDISVEGTGRFTAYNTKDGTFIRARFKDGALLEYLLGGDTFFMITRDHGRKELAFAQPDAEDYTKYE